MVIITSKELLTSFGFVTLWNNFDVHAQKLCLQYLLPETQFWIEFWNSITSSKTESLKTTFSMQLQWKSHYRNLGVKWCSNGCNCFTIFMKPVYYIQVSKVLDLVIYFYACTFFILTNVLPLLICSSQEC